MNVPEEQRNAFQVVQREVVLLIVIAAAAVPLYLFTRRMAAANRHRNAGIALDLYRRAQRQLARSEPDLAIDSLRQAVTNDRNNTRFVFALAQALAAAHHDDEARLAFLRLRDATPENPEINVQLARLSVRQRDIRQAVLYYHHALYGLWTGEGIERRRREVRIELIHLLLDHAETGRALAELLVLSDEAPQTRDDQLELAELFAEAGDLPGAQQHFIRAAEVDPQSLAALRGAGETTFRLGDYRTAAQFLARALDRERDSEELAELLETARLVESGDPLAPHLTHTEQLRRLTLALEQATRRVSECIGREAGVGAFRPSRLEPLKNEVETMRRTATAEALRRDPDLLHAAADLVFTVEETTSRACGAPRRFDHALLLIGRRHGGVGP